ncbi:MAG TPA: hypothetical protein VKB88_34775 [Bryobacteraceae bacterium]|nr:hypothetical protein [Bryobacteraceae bacterium]
MRDLLKLFTHSFRVLRKNRVHVLSARRAELGHRSEHDHFDRGDELTLSRNAPFNVMAAMAPLSSTMSRTTLRSKSRFSSNDCLANRANDLLIDTTLRGGPRCDPF